MGVPSPPTIYIVAGPNGAGKTTFATSFLPAFAQCREFLNADLIAAGLSPYQPESQAVRASQLLLERIQELVAARSSFSFETTLAARSYRQAILKWHELGFKVVLYFLWLPNADAAVDRVAQRVRKGGHNIPDEVIRNRYQRGLANLFQLYIPILSQVRVFDGSKFPPEPVWKTEDEQEEVLNYNTWKAIRNSQAIQ